MTLKVTLVIDWFELFSGVGSINEIVGTVLSRVIFRVSVELVFSARSFTVIL